jgi:POT family proton-dependent oligopeptide transporter
MADSAVLREEKQQEYEYDEKHPDTSSAVDSNTALDGIHDGLEFPTDDEKQTLRRVADTIPWTAYRSSPCIYASSLHLTCSLSVIALVELAERFSVCHFLYIN